MSAIIACSSCNHRFEAGGYRDEQCPKCGAMALRDRPCPRCGDKLAGRRIEQVVLDVCADCGGVFVDHGSLELLMDEHDHKRIEALLTALPASSGSSGEGAPDATCPSCELAMQKKLSSTGAGVVIDVCAPHGVFFDAGELKRQVTFVHRERREAAERREADDNHAKARSQASELVDAIEAIFKALLNR